MNRIYRLCWNRAIGQWIVASELASARSMSVSVKTRPTGRGALPISFLAMSLLFACGANAGNSPSGGQITAGSRAYPAVGQHHHHPAEQSHAPMNWQSFNIGADQTVDFMQPGCERDRGQSHRRQHGQPDPGPPECQRPGVADQPQWRAVRPRRTGQRRAAWWPRRWMSTPAAWAATAAASAARARAAWSIRARLRRPTAATSPCSAISVSNQGVITARLGHGGAGRWQRRTLTFDGSRLVHLQVDGSTLKILPRIASCWSPMAARSIMTAGARRMRCWPAR